MLPIVTTPRKFAVKIALSSSIMLLRTFTEPLRRAPGFMNRDPRLPCCSVRLPFTPDPGPESGKQQLHLVAKKTGGSHSPESQLCRILDDPGPYAGAQLIQVEVLNEIFEYSRTAKKGQTHPGRGRPVHFPIIKPCSPHFESNKGFQSLPKPVDPASPSLQGSCKPP